MKIQRKKMKKTGIIQIIQKEKIMKTQITRINRMFLTSLLIVSLGYSSVLTFNSNVKVDNLTIETGDKVVVSAGFTVTVLGAVNVNGTGELEIATGATVDAAGAVTIVGTLDMDGTARLMVGGNLTFTSATLEDADGNGIYLDGGATQTVSGTITGKFDNLICSGGATILDLTVAIEDSLDTGGQNFTIAANKTLTMNAGSVTKVSGGTWDLSASGAALTLDAASKFLYDTASNATLTGPGVTYGIIEHNGGELTQSGALNVAGIFTNTSGNFVASQTITANGIVWTLDAITGAPAQAWDIGTAGIVINGGTFVATTGAFTVEGNWTNAGTFTASTSTVNFDKGAAQTVTSGGDRFNGVTISNNSTVNLADPFEFSVGTLTIDAGATFATLGFTFDDNNAPIVNNGTFEIHGDESFTTGILSIPGNTKVVDPAGCILTVTIGGLVNVNFESGSTIVLGEDMTYITGNIDVAVGTTLNMAGHNLTVANNMTVTNLGVWSAPSTPSVFTCANNATLAGLAMNFFDFTAATASAVIIFNKGITYTVANDLTLTGGDGTEMFLRSDDEVSTAIISNTGGSQSVNFVKVGRVEATAANTIRATNSWDIHGNLNHWVFDAMLYTFTTTGDWDEVAKWEQGRAPRTNDHIEVLTGQTLTLDGDQTIVDVAILGTGIIDVDSDEFTVNGDLTITGNIKIDANGIVDVDGVIDATSGAITFENADTGVLIADSTVTHLGAMTTSLGKVKYNAPFAQTIVAGTYRHLQVSDNTAVKTLGGIVTVNGDLTIDTGVTTALGDHNLTVTGATVIPGIVTINTAVLDANGSFNATGGTITFTGAGDLQLGGAVVTSLGPNLTHSAGTVTYDLAGAQTIVEDAYFNLIAPVSGTKTLAGNVTVNGDLTIATGNTLALGAATLDVTTGATAIPGDLTIGTNGVLDADGSFTAENGTITLTGTGTMELSGAVAHLGVLSTGAGTVNYDGNDARTIFGDTYFNLSANGTATKTLGGTVTLNGALLIDAATTVAMATNDLSVTGSATIPGTLNVVDNTLTITGASVVAGTININAGTVDANGTFNANGGTIDFTGAGELQLGDAVTHLGTLSDDAGAVTYDGSAQDVFLDDYWDLTAGGTATKTLAGAVTVKRNLSISDGVTLDVNAANHAVTIKQNFTCVGTGSFTSRSGTVTFNGTVNQGLTSRGSTFNDIVFANTGGVDKVLAIIDHLDINGDLTVTTGTFDITGAINVALAGNLSIANGANWTKGSGILTFDGTTQAFADGNTTPKNLGHISINQP